MKNIKKSKKTNLIYIIVLSLLFVVAAKGSKLPIDLAKELQKYGYLTETPEQIIEAANNTVNYYVRFSALELLKQRIGKLYNSPSTAGSAIRDGKATNGWTFWKYKNKKGELVKLKKLRK